MAGNKVYVQGSYIDVHDNENVYLSVDKAEVKVADEVKTTTKAVPEKLKSEEAQGTFLVHPSLDSSQEKQINDELRRLVARQGIQEICNYLKKLADGNKIMLPQVAEKAYNELVRMGMPNGDGFSLKTFMKYYKR